MQKKEKKKKKERDEQTMDWLTTNNQSLSIKPSNHQTAAAKMAHFKTLSSFASHTWVFIMIGVAPCFSKYAIA